MNADEQAIRDLVAKWMEASMAGDLETVLGLMADDVVFLVPGRAPFGKGVFAQASKAGGENGRIEGRSEIEEIQVIGDVAYMRNHLWVSMIPAGGGTPIKRTGYTLSVLRKQPNGKWLLSRDANLLTVDTAR